MATSQVKELFEDYEGFVDKFKPKKTTDDCYTPSDVYETVLNYVIEKYGISEKTPIVRPFYPGGDYENYDYHDDCIVIDNPPFSILSKILNFYIDNDIKFFLFCPALTSFGSKPSTTSTVLCVGANIIYENGAKVLTSFVTNLDIETDGRRIQFMSAPELYSSLELINQAKKVNKPKYIYSNDVATSCDINQLSKYGVEFCVYEDECLRISKLDEQKPMKKEIYGRGYLLSSEAANRLEAAKNEQAKRLEAAKNDGIEWSLSDREKQLIEELDKKKTDKNITKVLQDG